MSEFLTELNAPLKEGRDDVWVLRSPLVYESDIAGLIEVITGFETDLASVPRIPIAYMVFGGRAHREATLHDWAYRKDAINSKTKKPFTFMQANKVFLEAMKVRGKSFFIRWAMYSGVVAGGYFSYHKKNVMDEI